LRDGNIEKRKNSSRRQDKALHGEHPYPTFETGEYSYNNYKGVGGEADRPAKLTSRNCVGVSSPRGLDAGTAPSSADADGCLNPQIARAVPRETQPGGSGCRFDEGPQHAQMGNECLNDRSGR
jgi:hypothetical protein